MAANNEARLAHAPGPDADTAVRRTASNTEIAGTGPVDIAAQDTARDAHNNDDHAETASIGNQRNTLSKKRLLVAFPALCAVLLLSFFDQTSVATALPKISSDLNTGEATSWIGTSFLISSTAFMLINGRLSDIFGRKNLLFICLSLLAIGDLLCGFAKTPVQLFVYRALAGIGGGGINSLVMIIVADITTLQNRGIYQGLIGVVHAFANGISPFIGGALVERVSWQWIFWIVPIMSLPAAAVILFALPLRHDKGNYVEKIKKIDFGGIVLNLGSVILLLVTTASHRTVVCQLLTTRHRFHYQGVASRMPGIRSSSSPCSPLVPSSGLLSSCGSGRWQPFPSCHVSR
jgi:MFS family permease